MTDPKLILCIEDDRDTAQLIAEEFGERGMRVELAYDGHTGFAAVLRLRPDLVLSDISMPVVSGFELLEQLKIVAPAILPPFIFLTALVSRDKELEGRMLGADDYVTKPIDFEILAAIVNTRLARAPNLRTLPPDPTLNEREIETLTWSARGKTSSEIAEIVNVAKRTVDFHIDNARVKLGAATRIEAAVKAVSGGLVKP